MEGSPKLSAHDDGKKNMHRSSSVASFRRADIEAAKQKSSKGERKEKSRIEKTVAPVVSPLSNDEIQFGIKDGRTVIVAGTIPKLIEYLADANVQDSEYVLTFIITHRYFTTSETFLEKLFERFNITPSPYMTQEEKLNFEKTKVFIRLRITNVLKKWIETSSSDFQNETLLQKLYYYLDKVNEDNPGKELEKEMVEHVKKLLNSVMSGEVVVLCANGEIPKPKIPRGVRHFSELSFLNISSREVARQMTLIEANMFRDIPKDEFLHKGFSNPELAPKMTNFIQRFNLVTSWIASEILRHSQLEERIETLAKFVQIGQYEREIQNFNGVMEVFSSLSMTPISRLTQTWKRLDEKSQKIFKEMEELMDIRNNYNNYRQVLKGLQPPVLPFQGVYLTDLTFIEENINRLENGLVNFEKMYMLGKLIREVHQLQLVKFRFEEVPIVRDWLLHLEVLPEKELYSRSKELEPPQPKPTSVQLTQKSDSPNTINKKAWLRAVRFTSMMNIKPNNDDVPKTNKPSDRKVENSLALSPRGRSTTEPPMAQLTNSSYSDDLLLRQHSSTVSCPLPRRSKDESKDKECAKHLSIQPSEEDKHKEEKKKKKEKRKKKEKKSK